MPMAPAVSSETSAPVAEYVPMALAVVSAAPAPVAETAHEVMLGALQLVPHERSQDRFVAQIFQDSRMALLVEQTVA